MSCSGSSSSCGSALALRVLGPVAPLHSPAPAGRCSCGRSLCDSPAKHPRTTHGLTDASSDAPQIESWWRKWPGANIGLRTDHLLVVDIDEPEAIEFLRAHGIDLDRAPRVRTGRGQQAYYRGVPGIGPMVAVADVTGFDIRAGAGSYVVAPGSVHITGHVYEWIGDVPDSLDDLPEAPEELLELLHRGKAPAQHDGAVPPTEWAELWGGVGKGSRNSAAAKLAGHLIGHGHKPPEVAAQIKAWNSLNRPPLAQHELDAVVASILRGDRQRHPERHVPDVEIGTALIADASRRNASNAAASTCRRVPPWPEQSFDELLQQPPVEFLVDELIPRSGVVVVVGVTGVGKSYLAMDLSARIAHGMSSWMGSALAGHGAVVIVALEGGAGLAGRARAWRKHHAEEKLKFPFVIAEPDDDAAILSPAGVAQTRERVRMLAAKHGRLALVVIDTATLATEGDENDAATWRAALRAAAQIAREHDCVALLVHHPRKATSKPGIVEPLDLNAARGSGAIVGNVDGVLGAEAIGDCARLVSLKVKDGSLGRPRLYTLDVIPTGMTRTNGRPETSCVPRFLRFETAADPAEQERAEAAKQEANAVRVAADADLCVAALAAAPNGRAKAIDDICRMARVGTKRGRPAVRMALADGRIEQVGRERWYACAGAECGGATPPIPPGTRNAVPGADARNGERRSNGVQTRNADEDDGLPEKSRKRRPRSDRGRGPINPEATGTDDAHDARDHGATGDDPQGDSEVQP